MNALKEQAIDSGMNLARDALRGNDMKESWREQVGNARKRGATTLERINKKRKVKKKKRYIFDG